MMKTQAKGVFSKAFVLRAKLLPPRSTQIALRRERLLNKLSESKSNLIVILAEAGYGKTTLAADFVNNSGRNYVWYQLDRTDSDISTFFTYLTYGIRQFSPKFGKRILEYIEQAPDEILRFPERIADLFLNEVFESIKKPFFLVLDDYHHLEKSSAVHTALSRLVRYASELISFLITTRDMPPIQLARSDVKSSAFLITTEELTFDTEEISELFKKFLDIELGKEEASKCQKITEGWVTALQLILQVAQQEGKEKFDLERVFHRTKRDIFQYFAEDVFAKEPEEVQRLLLHLSLFKDGSLSLCDKIFPDVRYRDFITDFQRRSIFLTSLDEREYRMHPLFRDFLQHRLKREIGDEAVKEKLNHIAEVLITEQRWEEAIEYLLQAENFRKIAQILEHQGDIWLERGRILWIDWLISSMPEEILLNHPLLLLQRAEASRLQGKTEESLQMLHKAVKIFDEKGDTKSKAMALNLIASVMRKQGRIESALQNLKEVEDLIKKEGGEDFAEIRLKLVNTKGLCLIAREKWDEAEECFRTALKIAEQIADEKYIKIALHNLALPAAFRGDFIEALSWFGKIISHSDKFPQEAIGHLNVARLHIFRGEFAEAEQHLTKSLEICQNFNLKDLMAEVLEAFGNLYRDRGDYQKASDFYGQAEKIYLDLSSDLSRHTLLEEKIKLYLLLGWHSKARGLAEKLVESRKKRGASEFALKTAQFLLAYVRAAQKDFQGLDEEVEKLREFFKEKELNYDEAQSDLLLARIYFAVGKRQLAFQALQRALELTARFDYDHWFISEMKANSEFFGQQDILDMLPDYFQQVLPSVSKEKAPKVVEIETPKFDLLLKTFGTIEARRANSKPVPHGAWVTKRARDIFFFIATSKNRRVLKETIMETFWSDEPLHVIEKNFHPTISHIRKALNQGQSLKMNFLVFSDGAYQINPEISCWIDTEEFENSIAQASKARLAKDTQAMQSALLHAVEIYAGEFMPGVYDDWAEERRRYFEDQYIKVLSSLAKLSFSQRDFASAIKYSEQVLQKDVLREDAYRLLMRAYAAQGKRASVVKCFNDLKDVLKKELGITPSPETVKLFQELTEVEK